MAFVRRLLTWAVWLAVIGCALFLAWQNNLHRWPIAMLDPSSEAAFQQWLDEEAGRREEFGELEAFLAEEDVAGIVPAWQLTRVDRFYAGKCNLPAWRLPPRDLWPNIVPALRLVREEVEPVVGEVVVLSSYRTPELNECARGASRSRHLQFEALDLAAVEPPPDLANLYRELCAMHEEAGRSSEMGLGAYYDFGDYEYNQGGRFHIDSAGYRTWGRSYTSASSPCKRFD